MAGQPAGEGAAFDERHGDVSAALGLAEIVDREDVRMDEVGEDAGFLLEARSELRVGGEQLGEKLERDEAPHAWMVGFVDLRHAALAEDGDDLILAELFADEVFHSYGPPSRVTNSNWPLRT